jgi:hypothetical protein
MRRAVLIRLPLNERGHIGSAKFRGLQCTGTKPFGDKPLAEQDPGVHGPRRQNSFL